MQFDLVFEGGGAKGMVFVGALSAFAEAGHTPGRLLGTSVGAITACLLAVGYTPEEMLAALGETTDDGRPVFETFMSPPEPPSTEELAASRLRDLLRELDIPGIPEFIERHLDDLVVGLARRSGRGRHLYQLIERGGWYSARLFENWLSERLSTGTFDGRVRDFAGCSLAQLHARTGQDLSLVATNTATGRMVVLNHRTAPQLPVVKAVRSSMNIPFVWPEVIWEEDWGPYRGRPAAGQTLVDGGALSNFPLELLVSQMPEVVAVMGEARSEGGAIGMLLDESVYPPGIDPPADEGPGAWYTRTQTLGRLQRLLDTMMVANDKMVIDSLAHRVVRLPAGGFGTMEFGMSPERREKLIAGGRQAMAAFLENLDDVLNDGPAFFGEESPADGLARKALRL